MYTKDLFEIEKVNNPKREVEDEKGLKVT